MEHGTNQKNKNIQNDNIKTQQTNNITNKQTHKLTNTKIEEIGGRGSSQSQDPANQLKSLSQIIS